MLIYVVVKPASYHEDPDILVGAYVSEELADIIKSTNDNARVVPLELEERILKK